MRDYLRKVFAPLFVKKRVGAANAARLSYLKRGVELLRRYKTQ